MFFMMIFLVESGTSDCVTLSPQGSCVTILAPPAGNIYLHLANVTVKPECQTNITNTVCLRSFRSCPNTSRTRLMTDPGFPTRCRGRQSHRGRGGNLLFGKIFPKNCTKLCLEGVHVPSAPLDPQ